MMPYRCTLNRTLYRARGLILTVADPAARLYRRRYRRIPTVHSRPLEEAASRPLEGYTDRQWYQSGQTATFFLRSDHPESVLRIQHVTFNGAEEVACLPVGECVQPAAAPADAERGCAWRPSVSVLLDEGRFRPGYFRATIHRPGALDRAVADSSITFLLHNPGRSPRPEIAVIAPVATWAAYNPYGGKSIYHNQIDGSSVYYASTLRPNPALSYGTQRYIHAMAVESRAFAWLDREFSADLFPDWALASPELLAPYSVLVLLYHNEYMSHESYRGLRTLIGDGRSLLAMGGNQIYWKIRWHENHTRIECRKDTRPFSDGSGPGGLWRNTPYPEDELLGCSYTPPGIGTYAPYRVVKPEHWLFDGTGVKDGDLFGLRGMTPYPICGDETDELTRLSAVSTEVIARGCNRSEAVENEYTRFTDHDPAWDGSGGGLIALTMWSARNAVLSTGAIHSPSGLGVDPVFTRIVRNFLSRFLPPRSGGG